jgi:multimeric flavodoxin WrbA
LEFGFVKENRKGVVKMNRRNFLTKGLVATTAFASASSAGAAKSKSVKIMGVSCSPRQSKTTATAVKTALDAAKTVDPRIKTELLDLGGLEITGSLGGTTSSDANQPKDDFDLYILPKLKDPVPDGLIIGSPSYFRTMSALCKAFLERIAVLRSPKLLLADKPVGVLAVGAYRNGGQELVIEQIQAAMLCHEVFIVGGKPRAHQGATLWNNYKDDITKDEFGMDSAKKLGIRVAEAALRLTQK